jgi:hypothetical protein
MARPAKYKTPAQMQKVIDSYFEECRLNHLYMAVMKSGGGEVERTPDDNRITEDEFPTVSGLALVLNMTRQGIIEYAAKDEFSDTVKRAKLRIESHLEQRLYYPQPTGAIFNLKNNYGWKDKTETDLISSDGSMTPKAGLDTSKLSTETLQELMKAYEHTSSDAG